MQVSVESTGALERKMTVVVPEERIEQEVAKRLKSISKTAKLDGFRPGKVPFSIIQKRYGQQVRDEVMGDVIQSTYYEAVVQEKLNPAGAPTIEPQLSEPGKGLEYHAVFEVYPEVKLASLAKAKIEKPVVELDDKAINTTLDRIREQRKTWEVVERAAANGDQVTIDFKGMIDGVAFPGGEAQDFPVELGVGRMIKGFEEGIVGASAGDELKLELKFPDDYHAENLAGKDVLFEITVKSVSASKLPEVDDEFAKSLELESVDKLMEEIRSNMQREIDQAIEGNVKSQVMDALLKANDITAPKAVVDQEAQTLAGQMRANLEQQGISTAGMEFDPEMHKEEAERRVKLGLLLSEIIKQKDFKANEEDVDQYLHSLAESYDDPNEVVKWYKADKNRLAEVQSIVLEKKVVDSVLEEVTIKDKSMSFEDVMGMTSNK